MTTLARALVAAAIIGLAAGGALFIQRSNEALVSGQLASPTVAAPRPTVGPEASPAAAGPQGFTEAYLSELYSYGLRYPATWTMTPGTVANRSDYLPELAEGRADFYGDTMSGHGLMVTSAPVSSERTDLAAWSAFVANAVPQKFGGYLGISTCAESTRALTVDGELANELDFICPEHDWLWVTAVHAGRAYQIAWLDDGGFDSDYLRPATWTGSCRPSRSRTEYPSARAGWPPLPGGQPVPAPGPRLGPSARGGQSRMFYVSRGSIPPTRHTQHRAPDGSLYAEELFGVEGFTGRSSLLYHLAPPTRVTRIEPMGAGHVETADDGSHHHQLIEFGRSRARRRRHHRAHPAVPQRRCGDGRGAARRRRCRPTPSTATAKRTRCCSSTRGPACCGRTSATSRYHPGDYLVLPIGTTWRLDPDAGVGQRMLFLECPSELEPPKRYRNDYGQLLEHSPVLAARHPRSPSSASPRNEHGRLPGHRPCPRPAHRLPLRDPPVRRRRLGRLPVAVRASTSRTSSRSPGRVHQPPPVHQTFAGAQLRRVLVRAPQVRLPPARDPGALQPLEHQQRRGHLLRRRQLHEPPRRGHRVVHAPPGGHPARTAPGHGRGVDRQGGDRGAGGDGRHLPARCG